MFVHLNVAGVVTVRVGVEHAIGRAIESMLQPSLRCGGSGDGDGSRPWRTEIAIGGGTNLIQPSTRDDQTLFR